MLEQAGHVFSGSGIFVRGTSRNGKRGWPTSYLQQSDLQALRDRLRLDWMPGAILMLRLRIKPQPQVWICCHNENARRYPGQE